MTLPTSPAWLDDVHGEQAMAWVEAHNAATTAAYAEDPDFQATREALDAILSATDKIPVASQACALLYNLWTDAEHPRGLWRRTTWEGYRTDSWETLLDLDALGRDEGRAWVWHGASVLRTGALAGRRALVNLSDSGSDTDVTREFDLAEGRFIDPSEGGFARTPSKGWVTWADEDGESVLMGADWGPESLTPAGYARQVRLVRRGQDPAEAPVVHTAAPTSMGVWAYRDRQGRNWITERPDFYTERVWLLPEAGTGTEPRYVEVPLSAQVSTAWDVLLISLREDWEHAGTTYPAGSLLAARLESFLEGDQRVEALFTPTATTFLQGWSVTANHLVLHLLDDVVDAHMVLTPQPDAAAPSGRSWARRTLELPAELVGAGTNAGDEPSLLRPGRLLAAVSVAAVDGREGDRLWLTVSSFTQPTTLAVGELDATGHLTGVEVLRRAPQRYDATGIEVTQHTAVSADGTAVPYFQVGRPGSGPAPTILYGYGGFEKPLGISYLASVGKAWLERGGVYVLAGIRGGGEYGPAWHRAGLRERRHRVYEDFAAVARALTERGVCTPQSLAVHGGSNGGLLVGNMLTQYPHLIGAVVCEVPLLDMQRYTHLLAGASWAAEYGDPDVPEDWEFIQTFSPYHLLKEGVTYPPTLLVTATSDDRVHPAHARTMAYRMEAMGQDVTYFENAEGGHGRAATDAQRAWVLALEYTFAWRTLGGSGQR